MPDCLAWSSSSLRFARRQRYEQAVGRHETGEHGHNSDCSSACFFRYSLDARESKTRRVRGHCNNNHQWHCRNSIVVVAWFSNLAEQAWFAAWPLAILFLILFIWATINCNLTRRELQRMRSPASHLVPEDGRLFEAFKAALPKESYVLWWLRNRAEARSYQMSDVKALRGFLNDCWYSDRHFINDELEQAYKSFAETALDRREGRSRHCSGAGRRYHVLESPPI